jgi:hypothetical protein
MSEYLNPAGRRLKPHRHLRVDCLENVGASTSHNTMGLRGILQGQVCSHSALLCLPPVSFTSFTDSSVGIPELSTFRDHCLLCGSFVCNSLSILMHWLTFILHMVDTTESMFRTLFNIFRTYGGQLHCCTEK